MSEERVLFSNPIIDTAAKATLDILVRTTNSEFRRALVTALSCLKDCKWSKPTVYFPDDVFATLDASGLIAHPDPSEPVFYYMGLVYVDTEE